MFVCVKIGVCLRQAVHPTHPVLSVPLFIPSAHPLLGWMTPALAQFVEAKQLASHDGESYLFLHAQWHACGGEYRIGRGGGGGGEIGREWGGEERRGVASDGTR
jgi:hypothetical protein